MSLRICLVSLEDRFVRRSQDVLHLLIRPSDEIDIALLSACNTVVHPVVSQDDDVRTRQDCCHVLCILDTSEGGSNQVEEVLMLNSATTCALHLFEELTIKNRVVGVVTSMTSSTLVELRRRVASPNCGIFFLSDLNVKRVWKV